jgi:hypothetical protein
VDNSVARLVAAPSRSACAKGKRRTGGGIEERPHTTGAPRQSVRQPVPSLQVATCARVRTRAGSGEVRGRRPGGPSPALWVGVGLRLGDPVEVDHRVGEAPESAVPESRFPPGSGGRTPIGGRSRRAAHHDVSPGARRRRRVRRTARRRNPRRGAAAQLAAHLHAAVDAHQIAPGRSEGLTGEQVTEHDAISSYVLAGERLVARFLGPGGSFFGGLFAADNGPAPSADRAACSPAPAGMPARAGAAARLRRRDQRAETGEPVAGDSPR